MNTMVGVASSTKPRRRCSTSSNSADIGGAWRSNRCISAPKSRWRCASPPVTRRMAGHDSTASRWPSAAGAIWVLPMPLALAIPTIVSPAQRSGPRRSGPRRSEQGQLVQMSVLASPQRFRRRRSPDNHVRTNEGLTHGVPSRPPCVNGRGVAQTVARLPPRPV
jgi:hypothetical protein